ncbi:hypothetical protein NE857_20265 [Nocardiopsis exhalans]|uniref:Uncharacterized protein n=1 Tax=Nocardiopsis exhalans TaxID=163604 RepID=A0ABY5D3J6_9ACTN|nr:hypothetical protein [Nocardiopsis exhalans]USY17666.1 hypothetical protein NE857_20265 [Nocardiopsis exhalans]
MRSPSGPPIHPPTLLGACSVTAACLGTLLLVTLTAGHPLLGGFPYAFLGLALTTLSTVYLAALPRRPGPPPPAPAHTGRLLWMSWLLAAVVLLGVATELRSTPRLWPLLLLPLAGLFLAYLATRAHHHPAPVEPRRYPPSASQNFGTAALTITVLGQMFLYFLHTVHPLQARPGYALILLFLVGMLVALVLQAAEPVLPPRFSGSSKPPMVTSVFMWLAWLMVPLSAIPSTVTLIEPRQAASLWPFTLFPAAALLFAVLSTRAHRQERARQRQEEAAR